MLKNSKPSPKGRNSPKPKTTSIPNAKVNHTISTPEILNQDKPNKILNFKRPKRIEGRVQAGLRIFGKSPRDGYSASETCLSPERNDNVVDPITVRLKQEPSAKGDEDIESSDFDNMQQHSQGEEVRHLARRCVNACKAREKDTTKEERLTKCFERLQMPKKSSIRDSSSSSQDSLLHKIKEIHNDSRRSARLIKLSRTRLLDIQKKSTITEADLREIGERNEMLLREMERFDRLTRSIQKLVGVEVASQISKTKGASQNNTGFVPSYNEPTFNELKMTPPGLLVANQDTDTPAFIVCEPPTKSKSEIDLTRKLSESYDMQEKLVADNADLEVKRYILYKELMTKDQNLETCRAQIKRLQGELKMINKENALLHKKLNKNNPEGDATTMKQDCPCKPDCELEKSDRHLDIEKAQELVNKLENYKTSTIDLEKQLGELEFEVRHIREEMDAVKQGGVSGCKGGGGQNVCHRDPAQGPLPPPMTKACGVCPPCPAPCNPDAPPTPAEREVQRLTIQLRQTEENFKTKVTECAMLRADLLKRREELDKERCLHRETANKLRELEMRFEGLTNHTNMLLGTKEEALEAEVNVRALKQCYREAREEIDELRLLLKEQNDQLQDYRVKYLHAQQLVEEQRRQMDLMDMDNTRISEQINLEIQKVKLKFQEKLQELAPIPDLLKATQMRLKDAQQSQAIAEHNAEQLARELNCAREKVHALLHNAIKPPEKVPEKNDEKQMALLNQRISQLTETNMALKQEIDRLKANVIRMEEAVLANEKRLQEKMHECAALGGELDRARDEAARALQRANERTDTIKKCLQTTVSELERQLAASRAQVASAEKEREELQCRMQCQIKRLNDNFEQAQLRILGLNNQVQTLRRTVSSNMGDGEPDEDQDCTCKSFFDNP